MWSTAFVNSPHFHSYWRNGSKNCLFVAPLIKAIIFGFIFSYSTLFLIVILSSFWIATWAALIQVEAFVVSKKKKSSRKKEEEEEKKQNNNELWKQQ